MDPLSCNWDTAKFLIFSGNVFDPLIYYSHFFALIPSFFIGLVIFLKDKKSLLNRVLFFITATFSLWVFSDLVLWASEKPSLIMFFWSLQVIIEPIIYALCLYFIYIFIKKEDISFNKKFFISILLIPTLFLASTKFALLGYNLSNCDRESPEGPLALYGYLIEIIYSLWILIFAIKSFVKSDKEQRKQIRNITLGIVLFLFSFAFGNIIGSFTDNWTLGQIGLFGMPIFVAFLSYMIVKFKTFNIKIIGTQVLVFTLGFLVIAMSFVTSLQSVRIVSIITFILVAIIGYILIKSVKREIEHRKEIEQLAGARENFIHFLSHEVKGILGKNINMFDLITNKDSGATAEQITHFAERSLSDTRGAVDMVENILHSNDVKDGKLSMDMKPFDMKSALLETIEGLKSDAEAKHLTIETKIDDGDFTVLGDRENIAKHVIRNLIDNSLRYTEQGGLIISLSQTDKSVQLRVKDTGVGITSEDMQKLFTEGGHGKDSIKVNVHSTGYGLYFAKGIVDAHHGKIWAESEGAGKGTTFVLELNK